MHCPLLLQVGFSHLLAGMSHSAPFQPSWQTHTPWRYSPWPLQRWGHSPGKINDFEFIGLVINYNKILYFPFDLALLCCLSYSVKLYVNHSRNKYVCYRHKQMIYYSGSHYNTHPIHLILLFFNDKSIISRFFSSLLLKYRAKTNAAYACCHHYVNTPTYFELECKLK